MNVADIWQRADLPRDGKAPVLLQVPGGAWAIGMRRPQAYPLLSHLAERGWVCVSIAYRVSPRNTWPAHIVDVKRALAWVKENIADYGGDPGLRGDHRRLGGRPPGRAGGADAERSAVAARIRGRRHVGGGGGADLRPLRLVSAEGDGRPEFIAILQRFIVKKRFADHKQVYVDASPITKVRPDAPPFFILHGEDDSIIPVREGREFAEALREESTIHRRLCRDSRTPSTPSTSLGSPHGHYTAHAVEQFLDWVHATRG